MPRFRYTSRGRRAVFYVAGALSLASALAATYALFRANDEAAIRRVVPGMGPEYLRGGREYVESTARRNLLLRRRCRSGESYIGEDGALRPLWAGPWWRPGPEEWRAIFDEAERALGGEAES